MAASATLALNAGVCVRRARLLIVSPDLPVNLDRCQAETPLSALFRFPKPALNTLLNPAEIQVLRLFDKGLLLRRKGEEAAEFVRWENVHALARHLNPPEKSSLACKHFSLSWLCSIHYPP
jgi:hypothetical protein